MCYCDRPTICLTLHFPQRKTKMKIKINTQVLWRKENVQQM